MSYLINEPAILQHRLKIQKDFIAHVFTGNEYKNQGQGSAIIDLLYAHIRELEEILAKADAELGQQFPEEEPDQAPTV